MTASPKNPFEYGQLSVDQAAKAKASAERIRQSARRHIIDVGLELIQMELLLGHGHYEAWGIERVAFFSLGGPQL